MRSIKFAANGGDAADDIGAVDGTSVPGVSGALGCFHKDWAGGCRDHCRRWRRCGVNDNGASETNLEEELLHANVGEIGGGYVGEAFNDYHTGKVAHHGGEDLSGAVGIVGGVARFPKIDMKAADCPREQELAVATDSVVSKDGVGGLLNQVMMSVRSFGHKKRRRIRCKALYSFICAVVGEAWSAEKMSRRK